MPGKARRRPRRRDTAVAPAVEGVVASLGRGGDGLLQVADGRQFYVAGTVGGDRVRARPQALTTDGPGPAALEALLAGGADRVAPPCPHFPGPGEEGCGGCRLQMLHWPAYLAWKADLARAALARAGIAAAEIADPLVAPERSRRRAGFALVRQPDGVRVGFHGWRSRQVQDISDACLVCTPVLTGLLPHLRALGAELLRPGRSLAVQVTATEAGLDVLLRGAEAAVPSAWSSLAAFADAADLARLSIAGDDRAIPEQALLRRQPVLHFGAVAVIPPAGGFLQAVQEIEAAMQGEIAQWLVGAARVLDLYAGCGTLSLPLIARSRVHAVDGDLAALAAMRAAADAAVQGDRVTVQDRDLARFPLVGPDLAGYDAAILDPPRQGAAAQAAALAEAAPKRLRRLAAVSCNPISLARDLVRLQAGGWRVASVRLYDQFLWTPHLELVALLERDG